VLLGALGVGAVGGAFVLPQVRARLSANALVVVASLSYAAALVVVVLSGNLALTVLVLLPAGVAWIAFLSNVNAALQIFLPRWVRARGLSVYQMVLFGAQAAGAVIWGLVAGAAGLVPAFLTSAAVMAAGAATLRFWQPTGACTRTARAHGCSSNSSASPAGTNTSGSTGSGRPAPTWSTTTPPRPCPTRHHKPATT
jgi:MFS family permease